MSKETVKLEMSQGVKELLKKQRELFETGVTKTYSFRYNAISSLYQALKAREEDLIQAFQVDMKKPPFESYVAELDFVYAEMRYAMKHLKSWMKPKRVLPTFAEFPAINCKIIPEPLGSVLIIGPWNYPFQLILAPLIGAIAAGNTAILKPSEYAPATAKFIEDIIAQVFSPDYVSVVMGGIKESEVLLAEKFDFIFFTGSIPVGKIIAAAAAKHLTPSVLELGGKSPCIVHCDISGGLLLKAAARRVVWGKFLNGGQTCVAPDYLIIHEDIKKQFLEEMIHVIKIFYGEEAEKSKDYARIINERHFDRLVKLMTSTAAGHIICGGKFKREELFIAPTVIDNALLNDPIMNEEIFGPIFPVLTYRTLDDLLQIINHHPNPLALYLFAKDKSFQREILSRISFGGGCINDTVMHLVNHRMPFGGRGTSGFGAYHGRYGFDTFSHKKSVLKNPLSIDNFFRYPPYPNWKLKLIRKFL